MFDESSLRNRSEKIFESMYRIGKIIDHIRVFSREQQDYILTLFDVNESIINAQSMISEQFRLKKIGLVNVLNKKNRKLSEILINLNRLY